MKPSSLDVSLSLFSYTSPWCYQVREVMPHYYQSQLGGTDRVSTFVFPPSFTIIITTYLLMRFFFVPTLLLPGQLIDSVILPCSLLGATQLNNNHQSWIWTMSKCGRQSEERRKNPRNQRVDKNKKEMALSLMVWLRLWQVGRPFIFSTSAG